MAQTTPPLIVALTGATGMSTACGCSSRLRTAGVPSHLVMSKWAIQTLLQETA